MDATAAATNELLLEVAGGVARLTLNRPDKRNALSESLLEQLAAALAHVAGDAAVRVVVLAAHGPAFCSGHDLRAMVGRSQSEYQEIFSRCSGVMQQLRFLPQPVIARVQSTATAAGCQLVAACDLAVAADTATFATPGVKIGLFCTTPMVPLVRAIPAKPAMEMLLTGAPISAARAYELGLVNRVVPAERLDAAVDELVEAILAASPLVIRLGKGQGGLLRSTCARRSDGLRPSHRRHDRQRRPTRGTRGDDGVSGKAPAELAGLKSAECGMRNAAAIHCSVLMFAFCILTFCCGNATLRI